MSLSDAGGRLEAPTAALRVEDEPPTALPEDGGPPVPALDDPGPGPRRGRRVAAVGALLLAAGGAAWLLTRDGAPPPAAATARGVATGTATVERRDLVDRQDVDGTLEFAGARDVAAPATGTVTRIAAEGAVLGRGRSLVSIDGRPTAIVMFGALPMYRDLGAGVSDGPDVRQLQRNLIALGHDPYRAIVADGEWSAATTAAVRRWQDARDVEQSGRVALGELLFADGPIRVGSHAAAVGDHVSGPTAGGDGSGGGGGGNGGEGAGSGSGGGALTAISSTRRVVSGRLDAGRQGSVDRGDRVEVTLPDGDVARGVVERVGRVARAGQEGGDATVALRVRLRGRLARSSGLDRAPVTISVATEAARDALSVPITALVARGGGRYAVERPGGRLVAVETGVFADGYVEIDGALRPGERVVVPR
ncbi:peptidoglycan-binding protein [Patulibacter defluvii]|uniref:peptidoglycan-binding protein n=1 Tax=Patulibacter defluvii TaxID=3095358 RepID=UPI002A758F56|nr:peptidoglycan-binding protein [Patulibacter sp. DM4]